MDFSVIIVNYNLTQEVKNCIDSLLITFRESSYEIILVDNNSEDKAIYGLVEYFKSQEPVKFTFIQLENNIGFGNACNLAAQQSHGKILFFLNPDTIVKHNFLGEIINIFNNDQINIGIVGLNVSANSRLDFSAGVFPNFPLEILNLFLIGRYTEALYIRIKSLLSKTKILNVDWVMGAALFIKKEMFKSLNGFDADYFLYFEEMDLCKRVKKIGSAVVYSHLIYLDHIGSVSSKKNYYFFTKMFYKGKLLFLKKHSTKVIYKTYLAILSMHFIVQIGVWWLIQFRDKKKSFSKRIAFYELLRSINNPAAISNKAEAI